MSGLLQMLDWPSVFDEAYPFAGASQAELQLFTRSVGQRLAPTEMTAIRNSQSNPFPKKSPLYEFWQPADPSRWVMPDRPLPESYLSFLSWSNGGEFRQGQRWMQFFPLFDERHGVRAIMLAYELPQCMPGALPFAANGGGTFYLFDMRQPSKEDEYNVVCSHAGNFGWGSDECLQIADSFAAACLGKSDVDELKWQAQR